MRALLLDPTREELLLIKALVPDTGDKLWFTPGGGKEGDESDLVCLAREVFEETGLEPLPAATLVWTRSEQFVFMGEDYHQDERYFLVPTPRFEIAHQSLEAHEQQTFLEARWWSLDDIVLSSELFVPADLGTLMKQLLREYLTESKTHNSTQNKKVRHVGR